MNDPAPKVELRQAESADLEWVLERHSALYVEEYGWDPRFAKLVEKILVRFESRPDASRGRAWIATVGIERAGCVFCMDGEGEGQALLRLLLVEPPFRRLGVARTLVRECIRFATEVGYRTLDLWTNDVLAAARPLYESEGFRLIREEEHSDFGPRIVGQSWSRPLRP